MDKKASTATGYAWLIWEKDRLGTTTQLAWIPACRKALEREGDYQQAPHMLGSRPIANVVPLRKIEGDDLFTR